MTYYERLEFSFTLCSHSGVSRIDQATIPDTILSAPGWARVGIIAPNGRLRDDAIYELAQTIIAEIDGDQRHSASPDQLALKL
jgi:hypothetical protein